MVRRGVMPDEFTEYELAEAFSSSPEFASQTIHEARNFRDQIQKSAAQHPDQPAKVRRCTLQCVLQCAFQCFFQCERARHLVCWWSTLRSPVCFPV